MATTRTGKQGTLVEDDAEGQPRRSAPGRSPGPRPPHGGTLVDDGRELAPEPGAHRTPRGTVLDEAAALGGGGTPEGTGSRRQVTDRPPDPRDATPGLGTWTEEQAAPPPAPPRVRREPPAEPPVGSAPPAGPRPTVVPDWRIKEQQAAAAAAAVTILDTPRAVHARDTLLDDEPPGSAPVPSVWQPPPIPPPEPRTPPGPPPRPIARYVTVAVLGGLLLLALGVILELVLRG